MSNNRHIHKRLSEELIKETLSKYNQKLIKLDVARAQLGLSRSRFYHLLKCYRENTDGFSIQYQRMSPKRLPEETEQAIMSELTEEKKLIDNKELPIRHYNYSYVRERLKKDHDVTVSVPTIINRAKIHGCHIERKRAKTIHDREVLTEYVGQLTQHDTSKHKWSPYVDDYWYLITSLDDYSRMILYADLFETETSYKHIFALESVCLVHGVPLKYYADRHSIFKYVQGRDSQHHQYKKHEDEVVTQWGRVCDATNIEIVYAMSPQAKGKIERPYRWLQDHIVRRCARDNITNIEDARMILKDEVHQYNRHRVHSTTKEIPIIRYEQAIQNGRSVLRPFSLPEPFKDIKDVFCLRHERVPDAYRNVSLFGATIKVSGALPRQKIQIHMYPNLKTMTVELRFWFRNKLIDTKICKTTDLKGVQF